MNMALDEACMNAVREKKVKPTVRLFGWNTPSVTIGCFQCVTDEVDMAAIKEDNIPITRRITGGGAVYHDAEITYSVVAPEELFSKNIATSYGQIVKPLMQALNKLGVETRFRALNDVMLGEKKVSGNAQTRKGGVLLQHGTIILSVNEELMFRYLTPDANKNNDKPFIKSNRSAVAGVLREGISSEDVLRAVREELIKTYRAVEQVWSEDELIQARELAKKYASQEWIFLR